MNAGNQGNQALLHRKAAVRKKAAAGRRTRVYKRAEAPDVFFYRTKEQGSAFAQQKNGGKAVRRPPAYGQASRVRFFVNKAPQGSGRMFFA